jgi:hypothetical protein
VFIEENKVEKGIPLVSKNILGHAWFTRSFGICIFTFSIIQSDELAKSLNLP